MSSSENSHKRMYKKPRSQWKVNKDQCNELMLNEPMQNVSISIPIKYDIACIKLVEKGFFRSRSQIIRTAIGELLEKDTNLMDNLDKINQEPGEQNGK